MTLHLHGLGHFHPENEITNRFLEELEIGTDDAWILERVGIRSRRTVLPLDYIRTTRNREPRAALEAALYDNAAMGRRAAELRAGARRASRRATSACVIAGGSAADTASPAEACNIARALELEVPAFDVSSACTSFLAQLHWLVVHGSVAAARLRAARRARGTHPHRRLRRPQRRGALGRRRRRRRRLDAHPGPRADPRHLVRLESAARRQGRDPAPRPFPAAGPGRAGLRDPPHRTALRRPARPPRRRRSPPSFRRPPGESAHARVGVPRVPHPARAPSPQRRALRQHRSGERRVGALDGVGEVER